MRLILTILFLTWFTANATNYYVSNAGSNAANGLTQGTAWQTISKVNSSSFSAGDSILFKCGDSWNEQLIVPSSGSVGNPIIFASYGTGLKPIITGLQSLSLSNQGANIWSATATNSVKTLNTVIINGAIRAKGRYPNSAFLSAVSYPSDNSIKLGGTPANYVGGELVNKTKAWILDVCKISSENHDTLNVYPPFTYTPTVFGYFIQNLASLLDVQNEWSFDSTSKLLSVYSTSSPTVLISTIDSLVNTNSKNYLTFTNISFTGSNLIAISYDNSSHVTITNCSFNNNGKNAIQGYPSDYTFITSDSILNSLNDAIRVFGQSPVISNNYVYNTGMFQGMGASGNGTYVSIYCGTAASTVTNNKVINTGYSGIFWDGLSSLIAYNKVDSFCLNKDDGGAIYCNGTNTNGSIVKSNITTNGIGITYVAAGVYLDDNSLGVTVDSNTVNNCNIFGILGNTASNCTIRYNTVMDSIGMPMQLGAGGGYNIKSNILYSRSSSQVVVNANTTITSMDSNYYLRPISESNKMKYANVLYDLSGWITATGKDAHCNSTPSIISSIYGTLYYNPNLTDTLIGLNGYWVDAKGNVLTLSVTIPSFQSRLLFPISYRQKRRLRGLNFQ